ncbi:MAG: type III pantothenate kinase [Thiopseudomonas sp.]|nr:type III pantothenate kinase [Thiopseudomonas sp.]MCK9466668.1 type III pantothenate kinase [Thiopseudomonas sp.]
MIIELDCGNTSIKWRFLTAEQAVPASFGSVPTLNDLQPILAKYKGKCSFCRICSVRGKDFDQRLSEVIFHSLGAPMIFAKTAQTLAGVINGYAQAASLGIDRWLALVAAYSLYKGNCLVIDCGTAITADYVAHTGVHLGGVIAPGLRLLQSTLYQKTSLPQVFETGEFNIAVSTEQAIKAGISSMYSGFIRQQLSCAEQRFGTQFTLVLTGGDAHFVQQEFAHAMTHKDLVFIGLALACPYPELANDA